MKKTIIIVLLIIPSVILSQTDEVVNDEIKEVHFKNQIEFDFSLFGFGVGYKKRVFKNWFVGVNANAGYSFSIYHDMREELQAINNNDRLVGETLQASLLFSYEGDSKLRFAFGYRTAHFLEGLVNDDSYNTLMGVGFDFFYGRRIQLGFKSMLSFYKSYKTTDNIRFPEKVVHPVFTSTLLVLRIPVVLK